LELWVFFLLAYHDCRLQCLNIAANLISEIPYDCFRNTRLEKLNIAGNKISDAQSVIALEDVPSLRELKVADVDYAPNPIMDIPAFEAFIIHLLPALERVLLVALYEPLSP
jgi:hypothetical protein